MIVSKPWFWMVLYAMEKDIKAVSEARTEKNKSCCLRISSDIRLPDRSNDLQEHIAHREVTQIRMNTIAGANLPKVSEL